MNKGKILPHEEIFSVMARLLPLGKQTSLGRRFLPVSPQDHALAHNVLSHLIDKPDFIELFSIIEGTSLRFIGKGWNGITYQVTNTEGQKFALKIANDEGPVEGFGYKPTKKGYEAALVHLRQLKRYAKQHKLIELVSERQHVFFIPSRVLKTQYGKIINVQPFYEPLLGSNTIGQLKLSRDERARLQKEFSQFVDFFHILNKKGIVLDLLGYQNLALTISRRDGKYHFVLCDIGPANRKIAGYITEIGLQMSLWKEVGKWSVAFGSAELQQIFAEFFPNGKGL